MTNDTCANCGHFVGYHTYYGSEIKGCDFNDCSCQIFTPKSRDNLCECDCHIQVGGSGKPCPKCIKENCEKFPYKDGDLNSNEIKKIKQEIIEFEKNLVLIGSGDDGLYLQAVLNWFNTNDKLVDRIIQKGFQAGQKSQDKAFLGGFAEYKEDNSQQNKVKSQRKQGSNPDCEMGDLNSVDTNSQEKMSHKSNAEITLKNKLQRTLDKKPDEFGITENNQLGSGKEKCEKCNSENTKRIYDITTESEELMCYDCGMNT